MMINKLIAVIIESALGLFLGKMSSNEVCVHVKFPIQKLVRSIIENCTEGYCLCGGKYLFFLRLEV